MQPEIGLRGNRSHSAIRNALHGLCRWVRTLIKVGAAIMTMVLLSACSDHWKASMKLVGGSEAVSGSLRITMTSALGDHLPPLLVTDCVDVRIRQSPKLPNKITINVIDANGQIVGSAITHDLARRNFVISLIDVNASIHVAPGAACN